MAATKKKASSSKRKAKPTDATKTPSDASKASKVEERRPAPTIGDLAGAEFNPARTEEGERVAQTGANPRASRAGVKAVYGVLAATDSRGSIELSEVDGGSLTLSVDGRDVALTRDDALSLRKFLDAANLAA